MTKLEELKAACAAAWDAADAASDAASYTWDAACAAAYDAADAASDAYRAELKKTQEENTDD